MDSEEDLYLIEISSENVTVEEEEIVESTESVQESYVWGLPKVEKIDRVIEDNGEHSLLNEVSIGYSASVIQRAFITWMQLCRTNDFKAVCDYYHRLDILERSLPVERSLDSRRHEYQMIDSAPPMTEYFMNNWGHIYGQKKQKKSTEDRLQGLWTTDAVLPPVMRVPEMTMVPVQMIPHVPFIPVHQLEQEVMMSGNWST